MFCEHYMPSYIHIWTAKGVTSVPNTHKHRILHRVPDIILDYSRLYLDYIISQNNAPKRFPGIDR